MSECHLDMVTVLWLFEEKERITIILSESFYVLTLTDSCLSYILKIKRSSHYADTIGTQVCELKLKKG